MRVMQLSALVALIAMAMPSSVSAITDAAIKSQCQALSTCYKGGVTANTCSIQTEDCPPCVTFTNSGCFDLTNGKCNFGYDCTNYWPGGSDAATTSSTGSKTSSGAAGTSGTSGSKQSGTSGSAGVANNSSTNPSTTTAAPSSDTSSSKSDGGTDMTVVFGIVGAAIGVIAVAIIFLALVRRSRAAEEDDEEMAATPPAMNKAAGRPSTATNASSYAPYAQRAGSMPQANPTTPTNRVIKYYQDNAMPSPHGGRGGGGFGQQPQQQPQVKTVRPAAAANAPTFFKPNPPTAPAPQARAVTQPPALAQQEVHNYYGQGVTAAPAAAPAPAAAAYPQAEPLFTVHTGSEDPQLVRRLSSPRPRRESYEF